MKNKFSFASNQYDFWPIYEAIKKYYPLGISNKKSSGEVLYNAYSGQEALNQLIEENLLSKKQLRQRWGNLIRLLEGELNKPVIDTSCQIDPCFSGYLELLNQQEGGITHCKELRFAVSLLGPFYTIFGIDSTALELEDEVQSIEGVQQHKGTYRANHALTCSPFKEYEQAFLGIQRRIAKKFVDYRFVPYYINLMHLPGLKSYLDSPDSPLAGSIYKALFDDSLDPIAPTRGNKFYGSEQWKITKPNPKLIFHGSEAEFQLLRRKWKVVNAKKAIPGNITFGLASTDIDFTTLLQSHQDKEGFTRVEYVRDVKNRNTRETRMYFEVLELSPTHLKLGIHQTTEAPKITDILMIKLDCIPI